MPKIRRSPLKSIFAGLISAVLFTLAAMLVLSLALLFLRFGDGLLRILNQAVKFFAIFIGAIIAVPRSGDRGLATGLFLSMIYMVVGYGLYVLLGGGGFSFPSMLGELLLGAAVGAVTGAVRANMRPRKRKST